MGMTAGRMKLERGFRRRPARAQAIAQPTRVGIAGHTGGHALLAFKDFPRAGESVARIHGQIRRLAADLRGLSSKFVEPKPVRALYAARELFLIWQDQPAALEPAPAVQWSDALGAEQVDVDAAALADVLRELLANAQAFGTGAPLLAASRVEDGKVAFELREPKDSPVETAGWGNAPFAAMRHGHYGLGLWEAQRTITASGGEVRRHFAKDTMELITTLLFPVA